MIDFVGLQSYGISMSWSEYVHLPVFEREVLLAEVTRRISEQK